MDCISRLVKGRSTPPPPLPPKPSAPPIEYPPQVPYYHPPTNIGYENRMLVLPQHFSPSTRDFYRIAAYHSHNDLSEQFLPVLTLFEDCDSSLPAAPVSKPPLSPVARRSTKNLPVVDSFVRMQAATVEFQRSRSCNRSRTNLCMKVNRHGSKMREVGRGGGALVAAAVAQLENKTHTRLIKRTTASSKPSSSAGASAAKKSDPVPAKNSPPKSNGSKEMYTFRGEPIIDDDTSSTDTEDYHRVQDIQARKEVSDKDSFRSSERETSEELCTSTAESDTEEETDSEDKTQDSVLERITEEGHSTVANSVASPDRGSDSDDNDVHDDESSTVKHGMGNYSAHETNSSATDSTSSSSGNTHTYWIEDTSTCCDEDFQWIKSEPNANIGYEQNDCRVPSPAPDTDDDDGKRIKPRRTEVQNNTICTEKPPVPVAGNERNFTGSLDRRRHHPPNRMDRDQKSKSSHNLKTVHYSPSRQYSSTGYDYSREILQNQNNGVDYCNNRMHESYPVNYKSYTPPRHVTEMQRRALSYEHFNRRHEHNDPQRYGSNCMLTDPRMECNKDGREYVRYNDNLYHSDIRNMPYYHNSRQDLHGSHGDVYCGGSSHFTHRSGVDCYCHNSHYCCSCSDQNRFRMHCGCKNTEAVDDRVRRLESDKDSLQLQVSVLSEQIAAQSEKINDLERLLTEKKSLLANAEELLQREILTRSSLETQKLELMSTVSEARLRQAALERENIELKNARNTSVPPIMVANGAVRRSSHSPSPSPSPASSMMQHNARDNPPRTPPATYRRLVNDQPHSYSSLPRGASLGSGTAASRANAPLDTAVVLRSVGFAEKDTIIGTASSPILGKVSTGGKGWGSLFKGGSGGALEDITDGDVLDPFQRGGVRATAAPRLQNANCISNRWSTIALKEWDADVSCEWLESLGLECYNADAKKWLTNPAGNKGILATASPQQVEKELNIKNALHKKKILLALQDMQESALDPLLSAAGNLDTAWTLRWLEDAGLPQYREAWAAARADGRVLHRLCHEDLHTLKVTSQLHALSIRRGIQVLRENNFSSDTMIRRGANNDVSIEGEANGDNGHVSRWSSHRVMEWLRAVDLAEYAPNLRGAGVHGGLMYYEVRFTGELLATLLNIPPSKTLLRRHLNTRFNQLLGKEIIQEKREAEQTLGYQPLTLTSKVKAVKKGQFTLKRKKNKNEPEYGDLVCPILDQSSGEILSMTKMEISGGESGVACRTSDEMSNSTDSPLSQRSDHSHS